MSPVAGASGAGRSNAKGNDTMTGHMLFWKYALGDLRRHEESRRRFRAAANRAWQPPAPVHWREHLFE